MAAATEATTKVKRAEIEDAPEVLGVGGASAATVTVTSEAVILLMPNAAEYWFCVATTIVLTAAASAPLVSTALTAVFTLVTFAVGTWDSMTVLTTSLAL